MFFDWLRSTIVLIASTLVVFLHFLDLKKSYNDLAEFKQLLTALSPRDTNRIYIATNWPFLGLIIELLREEISKVA